MTRRDAFQAETTGAWTRGAQFNFDLRLFEYLKWENHVHMDGTASQLRKAGWEFQSSVDKWPVQPFYYHHSQHALDSVGDSIKYPLIDRYGVRFVFYSKTR